MHSPLALFELALHRRLEPIHAVVLRDQGIRVVRRRHGGRVAVDVPPQAAGVVPEPVGLRVALDVAELGGERPEVDGHAGKGALGHAAAAGADGDLVDAEGDGAQDDVVVRLLDAVAREREFVAVEERRVLRVVRITPPVPVGLVAGVAAFGAEGVFVVPEVVAVPGQEEGLGKS